MELTVTCLNGKECTIEVGEDDTMETMREKVASAAGLAEDSFHMGFGGKEEGEDITALSAGDTIVLAQTKKYEAIAALQSLGEIRTDITTQRLMRVTDPKVASLLLQAEVVTAFPHHFFSGSTATCVSFSYVSSVDDICDTSLANCATKLHIPTLPFIVSIGNFWLSSSEALSTVDLTGLQSVTEIGNWFLGHCTGLLTVDLTGMRSLTTIGDSFLYGCTSLSTVNLRGLAVSSVGHSFLCRCFQLRTIDVTCLESVTSVGYSFLSNCLSLRTVDLSCLQSLTTIGALFLFNCTRLSTINLAGLKLVRHIGNRFLGQCEALSTIDISGSSGVVAQFVTANGLSEFVVEARPKRDESLDEARLSQ